VRLFPEFSAAGSNSGRDDDDVTAINITGVVLLTTVDGHSERTAP